ncbi:MAG: polyprenyl synthetase family protein [Candidatus Eremiobacteraeota bacterium]|nr:polyprenyl synthetase family protein [Candidatus Eremiobacteraeota bacterium]MBV8354365.1 polyprenyl synthetase family protein [Candidatus Eremiobacteraeota bacterium]
MIQPSAATTSERDLLRLVEEFFRTRFETDNPLITEAVRRMLAAGGKRLRPRIALLAAEAMGGDGSQHLALAAYMELIHVATLIHDDVVDGAPTRRGVNATAVDYGNRISVLAGDYLFAWIFKNVTARYPAPIPHILSSTLAAICDGEVLQLRAMGNVDLDYDGYVEIVRKKTATLFAASAECGAISGGQGPRIPPEFAQSVQALSDYGMHYGTAFQMMDDLLDMTAEEAALGKPVGNDLRERKVTLPLIVALQRGGTEFRRSVARFFEGGASEEPAAIAEIVAAIDRLGGFEGTRAAIAAEAGRAIRALDSVGEGTARRELVALATRLAP